MKTWVTAYCEKCKERADMLVFGTWGRLMEYSPEDVSVYDWLNSHATCPPLTLCSEDAQHEAVWERIGYPVKTVDLLPNATAEEDE